MAVDRYSTPMDAAPPVQAIDARSHGERHSAASPAVAASSNATDSEVKIQRFSLDSVFCAVRKKDLDALESRQSDGVKITEVTQTNGEPLPAPCAIDGCQYSRLSARRATSGETPRTDNEVIHATFPDADLVSASFCRMLELELAEARAHLSGALEINDINTGIATSTPDGWKMVPIELTPSMHEAGLKTAARLHANYEDVWHALIAATPVAPADRTRERE